MRVTCVTIDADDPGRLVDFWSSALGWVISHRDSVSAYCRPSPGGPGLEFVKVPQPKTSKNRVHLGTLSEDVEAEVARLIGLGASVAWEEDLPEGWPYRNIVMRDPEGNEFCLGDDPTHEQST